MPPRLTTWVPALLSSLPVCCPLQAAGDPPLSACLLQVKFHDDKSTFTVRDAVAALLVPLEFHTGLHLWEAASKSCTTRACWWACRVCMPGVARLMWMAART